MSNSTMTRKFLFIGIALLIFTIWFADGYMQLVNSDTCSEAFGISQNTSFPQGLVSKQHDYHSRITGSILSYIPFNIVGTIYRDLKNDPVNALYISQGVMSGSVFMVFILISAAYISTSSRFLSIQYLVSAMLLLLLTMALPENPPQSAPISLVLRFGHQAVTTNYIGTMTIALIALFPYWRYLFSGDWDDWYNDAKYRTIFYVIIIAAVFSSTATMIWMGVFAVTSLLFFIYYVINAQNSQDNIVTNLKLIMKNQKTYPLFIIITLCIVGVISESTTKRGASSLSELDIIEYLKIFTLFIITSKIIWFYSAVCVSFFLVLAIEHKKETLTPQLIILAKIFPWLVIGNLIFIFIIGLPRVPLRFHGSNLASDTVILATWSISLWLITVLVCFWRAKKLIWIAPLLLYALATNSLSYFVFSGYEVREKQKNIYSTLYRENIKLPMDVVLPISVENVAFSQEELEKNTIPMLRRAGIISSKRQISVVPYEIYGYWHEVFTKTGTPPLIFK